MIGPSVPARRAFFRPSSDVPELVQDSSNHVPEPVFDYALAAGWPSANSGLRLAASLLGVLCTFSFALIAAIASQRTARRVFTVALTLVAVIALVATSIDIVSIVKTKGECDNENCITLVPENVLESGNTCKCNIDVAFWFTVAVDFVLFLSAAVCLALTVGPMMKRRGIDPRRTAS